MKRPVLALLSHLSLSLLSLVGGCADESAAGPGLTFNACAPLDIGVAPTVTAEQLQGVTDAVAMWNQAAGTALASEAMPMDASSTGADASVPSTVPLIPLTFQAAAPPFHGLYDSEAGRIFVNEDLTTVDPLRITVAHEIGHAFGLTHVSPSTRRSLMNSGNLTIGITPDDVDALAAIWGRCAPATAATSSAP